MWDVLGDLGWRRLLFGGLWGWVFVVCLLVSFWVYRGFSILRADCVVTCEYGLSFVIS